MDEQNAVDDFREQNQPEFAWKALLRFFDNSDAIHHETITDLWIEHVTGRFSDRLNVSRGEWESKEMAPGCLFWPALRIQIQRERCPPSIVFDSIDSQLAKLKKVADLLEFRNEFSKSTAENSKWLLDAAAFSAKTALKLKKAQFFSQNEASIGIRPVWNSFCQTVCSYHRFWNQGVNSTSQLVSAVSDIKIPINGMVSSELIQQINSGEVLQLFYSHLRLELAPKFRNFPVALSMSLRAIYWLLDREISRAISSRLWVLLIGQLGGAKFGVCGQQALVEVERNLALLFPDPVYLGILPLSEDWRKSFDNASIAIRNKYRSAIDRSFCWNVEFMGRRLSEELTSKNDRNEFADRLRRPIALTGNSTSGAIISQIALVLEKAECIQLPPATIIASVDDTSELECVSVIPKLNGPIWENGLEDQIVSILVPTDSELVNWSRFQHSDKLIEVATLDSAIDFFKKLKCQTNPEWPSIVSVWHAEDQPPSSIVKGPIPVNAKPKKRLFLNGAYNNRNFLDDMRNAISAWLNDLQTKPTRIQIEDAKLPIFWIGGPSASGKSVALMFATAHIAQLRLGTSLFLEDLSHLPDLIDHIALHHQNENLITITIDDPYAPSQHDRKSIWDIVFDKFEILRDQCSNDLNIKIICCGPSDHRVDFHRDFTSAKLEIFDAPNDIKDEEKVLFDWYFRKTGESPAKHTSNNMMIAQLFWEWRNDESLPQFALNFRNRLQSIGSGALFNLFAEILGFNKLGLGFPSILLARLTAEEKDAYSLLKADLHFESRVSNILDGEGEEWLNHPHLAGLIYDSWRFGRNLKARHLLAPIDQLRSAKINTKAKSAFLRAFAASLFSHTQSTEEKHADLQTTWDGLFSSAKSWCHPLKPESYTCLPAWVEIRTYWPPRWSKQDNISIKPDPVGVALSSLETLSKTSELRAELILILAHRLRRLTPLQRKHVHNSLFKILKNDPEVPEWENAAEAIVKETKDKRMINVAMSWLKNHSKPNSREAGYLWLAIIEIHESTNNTRNIIRSLELPKFFNHPAWPYVWHRAWQGLSGNQQSAMAELGYIWLRWKFPADNAWHLVWRALYKYESKLSSKLFDAGIRMLAKGSTNSIGWARVWPILETMANSDEQRNKVIQLIEGRSVTHHAWPNFLRGAIKRNEEKGQTSIVMRLLDAILPWFKDNNIDAPGWPSAFGVLWDNYSKSHARPELETLYPMAIRYLKKPPSGNRAINEWTAIWARAIRHSRTPHLLLKAGLTTLVRIPDPTKYGVQVRAEIVLIMKGKSRYKDEAIRNLLMSSILNWLRANRDKRSWSFVWTGVVDSAPTRHIPQLKSLGILWLSEKQPSMGEWSTVFVKLLRQNLVPSDSHDLFCQLGISYANKFGLSSRRRALTILSLSRNFEFLKEPNTASELQTIVGDSYGNSDVSNQNWTEYWLSSTYTEKNTKQLLQLFEDGIDWLEMKLFKYRYSSILNKSLELCFASHLSKRLEIVTQEWIGKNHPFFDNESVPFVLYSYWIRDSRGHSNSDTIRCLSNFSRLCSEPEWRQLKKTAKTIPTSDEIISFFTFLHELRKNII